MVWKFIGALIVISGSLAILATLLGAGGAEDDIQGWLNWLGVAGFLLLLGTLALKPEWWVDATRAELNTRLTELAKDHDRLKSELRRYKITEIHEWSDVEKTGRSLYDQLVAFEEQIKADRAADLRGGARGEAVLA